MKIETIEENKKMCNNWYEEGLRDGKSQATKEILEDELKFCQELWDKATEYTCDGWVLILAGNRMEDIKQQLKKLGEGK